MKVSEESLELNVGAELLGAFRGNWGLPKAYLRGLPSERKNMPKAYLRGLPSERKNRRE
jgi:hypothetical protein